MIKLNSTNNQDNTPRKDDIRIKTQIFHADHTQIKTLLSFYYTILPILSFNEANAEKPWEVSRISQAINCTRLVTYTKNTITQTH